MAAIDQSHDCHDYLNDFIEETKNIMPYLASIPTIGRVPYELFEGNERYYKPRIAPIGPYHHRRHRHALKLEDEPGGARDLKFESRARMRICVDEMKRRRLQSFLGRLRPGVTKETLIQMITESEPDLRLCYEGGLDYITSPEFLEIMLLDGCFIVDLLSSLFRSHDEKLMDQSGSINLGEIVQDLLKLENQLPFFLLVSLHQLIQPTADVDVPLSPGPGAAAGEVSFAMLALNFFWDTGQLRWYYKIHRDAEEITTSGGRRGDSSSIKHLTHLMMISLCPPDPDNIFTVVAREDWSSGSVSKLNDYGVKFKVRENVYMPDEIVFRSSDGVLEIPRLTLDEPNASLLSNLFAAEMNPLTERQGQVKSYVFFMGRLIQDVNDVQVLRRSRILVGQCNDPSEIVAFFRNLTKNTPIYNKSNWDQIVKINRYCSSFGPRLRWHAKQALRNSDPVNGILLFILTFMQTLFSILGYSPPSKKKDN